jgi:hypothetical protein
LAVEIELPDGTILEAPDGADPSVVAKAYLAKQQGAEPKKLLGPWASAAIRPLAQGAASMPLMAMDAGVAARNMAGNLSRGVTPSLADFNPLAQEGGTPQQYELPSAMFNRALDSYTTTPKGGVNKGAEFLSSVLAGSRMPAPRAATQVPANFVKPTEDLVRRATLEGSRKAGYVVPPATTNPSITNKILESIGGKAATAQDAALRNQSVTNTLARRSVGMADDAPITKDALGAIRSEAGDAYEVLRKVGSVALDQKATQSLDDVAAKFTGSKLKDALGGGNDIPKIVQALKAEPLNGDAAVDAISLLRDKASVAYTGGDKGLSKAYRELSKTLEDLMERNLSGDALKNFRAARQLMAKTHTVEGALNSATGNVSATKLASQLDKKPLSGDLLTAARFGKGFPNAAREILDSGSVRNTDVILGAGTAALSREPSYLLYPFLRQGVRAGLLSDAGQSLTVPGIAQIPPGLLMGGLTAEEQLRYGLFGQQ